MYANHTPTAPGLMLSSQSGADRQSEVYANTKIGHNRSSLLVLSSSKEDEDENAYS